MTKSWLIVLLAVSGCGPTVGGAFCDVYDPVRLSREGAVAIVQADREAAERIAVNEELHDHCRE